MDKNGQAAMDKKNGQATMDKIYCPWLLVHFCPLFHYKKKGPVNLRLQGHDEKLGSDLLFHTLVCSTIGDEGLDF